MNEEVRIQFDGGLRYSSGSAAALALYWTKGGALVARMREVEP